MKNKNIWLLSTDKPSRLYSYKGSLFLTTESHLHVSSMKYQNIYITSEEEIKEGEYFIDKNNSIGKSYRLSHVKFADPKKIILTTDLKLQKDGVQAIDDEFLEWFVQNPNCEFVNIRPFKKWSGGDEVEPIYKIIIPKKEPKQETLEEAAERFANPARKKVDKTDNIMYIKYVAEVIGFKAGYKEAQKTLYSQEEVEQLLNDYDKHIQENFDPSKTILSTKEWFNQHKKTNKQ